MPTTPRKIQRYGWRKDAPDHRDLRYSARRETMIALPPMVDLRPQCPPPYDQGQLGSCTANAIAAAIQFDDCKESEASVTPSRLFIYYNERVIEGDPSGDNGGELRDGIKSVASTGYVPEISWPYDEANVCVAPPPVLYTAALQSLIKQYASIPQSLSQLKSCLAEGWPFVFGFSVFDSLESGEVAQTGILPMPSPLNAPIGGHAVLCVGYDDSTQTFIVRNSWGASWGQAGYFTMPYAYLLDPNLASDFWQIQSV